MHMHTHIEKTTLSLAFKHQFAMFALLRLSHCFPEFAWESIFQTWSIETLPILLTACKVIVCH